MNVTQTLTVYESPDNQWNHTDKNFKKFSRDDVMSCDIYWLFLDVIVIKTTRKFELRVVGRHVSHNI